MNHFKRISFLHIFVAAIALATVLRIGVELVEGVSSTFTQGNWSGGNDTVTALANATGWSRYVSKDAGVSAGATLDLVPTNFSTLQTSDYGAFTGNNTGSGDTCGSANCSVGGGFNAGTKINTEVTGTGSAASVVLAGKTGLVGLWHLNEATSGNVPTTAGYITDASAGGNNGTFSNVNASVSPTTAYAAGKLGGAITFDGVDDRISLGTSLDISALPMTITAWVNPTDYLSYRIILEKRDTWASNDMRFSFDLNTSTGAVRLIQPGSMIVFLYSPPAGAWTYLTVVADSGGTKLYVNGALQETLGVFTLGTDATAAVRIGSTPSLNLFKGLLDEIAIYDRALTAAEISDLYNSGAGRELPYKASGTFESATLDLGATNYTYDAITWNAAIPSAAQGAGTLVPSNMSGLVGLWHLDGTDGTAVPTTAGVILDSQVNIGANNGTFVNANASIPPTTAYAAGRLNTAMKFDGVDDYVDAGSASAISLTSMTIAAWINPATVTSSRNSIMLAEHRGGAGTGPSNYGFGIEGTLQGPNPVLQLNYYSGGWQTYKGTVNISANTWQHVAVTFDGATNAYKFYVNGTMTGSGTAAAGMVTNVANILRIGRSQDVSPGGNDFFSGLMDELAIFNRALSADEVKGLYDSSRLQMAASNCANGAANPSTCTTTPGWGDADTPFVGPDGTVNTYFTGPVGLWHLNEATSGNVPATAGYVTDATGRGNNGTFSNVNASVSPTTAYAAGKLGGAITFDGVDDYVNLGSGASLDITGAITLTGWIKTTSITTRTIVGKWDRVLNAYYWLGVYSAANGARFIISPGDYTLGTILNSNFVINDDNWHHVVGVYQQGVFMGIYVDGVLRNSLVPTVVLGSGPSTAVTIGAAGLDNEFYFSGSLDEVGIYSRALTAAEVAALYNAGAGREGAAGNLAGAGLNNKQYLKYKALLGSADTTYTPQLDDVTLVYSGYPLSAALASTKFDSSEQGNYIKQIMWSETNVSAGRTATVSLKSAETAAALDPLSYLNFTNASAGCTGVGTVTCNVPTTMDITDAVRDKWFQYQVALGSDGSGGPGVSQVQVVYDTAQFAVAGSGTPAAGVATAFTITAKDSTGAATLSNYGSISVPYVTITASTSPTAVNGTPRISKDNVCDVGDYNFTTGSVSGYANAAGLGAFSGGALTLYGCFYDAGQSFNISASALDSISVSTLLSVTVNSGTTSASLSTATAISPIIAGSAGSTITVTLRDSFGNAVSGHTVSVSSSRGALDTITPASAVTNASGTATFTLTSTTPTDATSIVLTATDTTNAVTLTQQPAVVVDPGTAVTFVIAGSAAQTAGAANALSITAKDSYGNTVDSGTNNYTGDKLLTFSGALAAPDGKSPAVIDKTGAAVAFGTATTITFTNGVSTAGGGMTLYRAENASIAATATGMTTPSPLAVAVSSGSTYKFDLTTPSAVSAGTNSLYTVTRKDMYGNLVTLGTDTVNLASTSLGANKKFSLSVGGPAVTSLTISSGSSSANFYYYDELSGTYSITATSSAGNTIVQTSDTGAGDTPNAGGFNAGTKTNTMVAGTGAAAGVRLLQASETTTDLTSLMAPWTSIFSDDFNRVDSTALGASWTEKGNFDIVGNRIQLIAGNPSEAVVASHTGGSYTSADYFVQAVVNFNGTTPGNTYLGVAGRRVNYGAIDSDGYYAFINGNSQSVYLYKRVAGVWTQLLNVAATLSLTQDYTVKLWMQGTTIKVFLDGVEKISVVDASLTAAGDAGISAGTGPTLNVLWDNFLVERLVPENIMASVFDAANKVLYAGGDSGRFGKYVPSTNTFTDLTSRISSFWGSYPVRSLAHDAANGVIYLGGGTSNTATRFAKYTIATDTAADLTAKVSGFSASDEIFALALDAANNALYLGFGDRKFGRYNTASYTGGGTYPLADTAYDLTAKVSGLIASSFDEVFCLAFDQSNQVLYLGAESAGLVRYNTTSYTAGGAYPAADTAYGLTFKMTSAGFSTIQDIYALALDQSNQVLYVGGGSLRELFRYNTSFYSAGGIYPAADTAYTLTSKITGIFTGGSNNVFSLAFDSGAGVLYMGGQQSSSDLARLAKYTLATDTATDLTAQISAFWPTGRIVALSLDPDGKVYPGGYIGHLAKYSPVYPASGTFESATLDLGSPQDLGTISWTATVVPSATEGVPLNMSGLVGLWRLNEATSGNVPTTAGYIADATGSGSNGTFSNLNASVSPSTSYAAGKLGGAIKFDGVDDRVDIGGTTVYAASASPFSISAWVNLTSFISNVLEIAMLRTNTASAWHLILSNSTGYLGISIGSNTSWASLKTDTNPSSLTGAWHHVTATYNGAGAATAANFKIYLDGALQTLSSANAYGSAGVQGTSIGNFIGGLNQWNGVIDEVAVFNRELTLDEVKALYASLKLQVAANNDNATWNYAGPDGTAATYFTSSGTAIPPNVSGAQELVSGENGLVGLWHLNGTVGSVANGASVSDATSGGHNGTASNANGTGLAYQSGKFNQAMNFDGIDDYVDAANFGTLGPAFTVSVWANTTDRTVLQNMFLKRGTGDSWTSRIRLTVDGPGAQVTGGIGDESAWYSVTRTGLPDNGAWYHYVLTYDNNNLVLYMNGLPVNTQPLGAGRLHTGTSADHMRIGADRVINTQVYTPQNLWKGTIDEVAVFNRALSATEIKEMYSSRYLRYKASLSTADTSVTPSLDEVRVAYTPANTQTQQVNPGPTSQIVLTTSSQPVTAGVSSGVMTVVSRDQYGNINTSDTSTVNLSSNSATMRFDTSSSGLFDGSITSVTLVAGQATVYFKDTTAGTPTITFSKTQSPVLQTSDAGSQDTPNAGGFNAGTKTSTMVAGTGSAAKITLLSDMNFGDTITTGNAPYAVAFDPTQNAVWVVNSTSNTLQKFNASTGAQIGANIVTATNPNGVAFDSTQNAVWVASNSSSVLQKFNASTGAQIGTNIATAGAATGVAYDPTQNAVWVRTTANTLQKFNASTGAQIGANIAIGAGLYGRVAYDSTQNAVWVTNSTSNTLQKFNAATGVQIGVDIATAVDPEGVAFDPTQNAVWVACANANVLQKFNASTGAQIGANIATGLNPSGISYDPTQNAVWVVNWSGNTLQKFNASTGAQIGSNITTGSGALGVAFDSTQNTVWVVNINSNTLQKFKASDGLPYHTAKRIAVSGGPRSVAYDSTQNAVWIINSSASTLQKFNASTGSQIGANITTGSDPRVVAYDPTQNAVWVVNYGASTLQKFNASTGAQIGANIVTGSNPWGLAYDPTQNAVWVTSTTSNILQKFNAATGAQIGGNITTGTQPRGVAYDSTQNAVWVASYTSGVFQKFDAATGAQIGSNISVAGPIGVAYDPAQNAVWVASYDSNILQKFNAATGSQIGSNIATGSNPVHVAYDSSQNAVWVVNYNSSTLQKFNAATGAQITPRLATDTNPRGVVFDPVQNAVWVVNYGSSTLQQILIPYASASGTFESATLDLGSPQDLGTISWNPGAQPANTSLTLQVAANNDNATWNYADLNQETYPSGVTVRETFVRQDCTGYTAGTCYTSLSAWEAAKNRDLVALNEIEVAKIDGAWTTADTTAVTIDGWTTDATHYIRIYTTSAARHQGKWDNSKYRLESSTVDNGSIIRISENYVKIAGLQIKLTGINNTGPRYGIIINNSDSINNVDIKIAKNIIVDAGAGSTQRIGINLVLGGAYVYNNLIYDFGSTGIDMPWYNGSSFYIYNNTVYGGAGAGISRLGNSSVYLKNNISSLNIGGDYTGTFTIAVNNISSDATSPSGVTYQNKTVAFVDTANRDFHLASADTAAKNAGIDLSADANLAVTTDIEGHLRSTGGTWDIGAHEYGASGGNIPASLDNNRYVRYKAAFSTADTSFSPQLDDLSINYQSVTSQTETVIPGPVSSGSFTLNAPADLTAGGLRAAYTVTRRDQYNNLITSGPTTVYLYTTSNGANARFYDAATGGLPITSVVIPDGASSANFWYYDDRAGSWTITASDATPSPDGATAADDATDALTVNPAPASRFVITGSGAQVAGVAQQLTISAYDSYNNLVSSGANNYTGDKALTFSGAGTVATGGKTYSPTVTDKSGTKTAFGTATTLTFTNGVSTAGASMTLYRPESALIAATDGVVTTPAPLAVAVTGALTLNAPNGAETWRPGVSNNISWNTTAGAGIANVKLSYSTDAGATYRDVIVDSVANTGVYPWTPPSFLSGAVRVRVENAVDPAVFDESNANFSIIEPLLTIANPSAAGIILYAGQPYSITWSSDGAVSNALALTYSTDGGVTYPKTIASGEANDGTYAWIVPYDPTVNAKVKIEDVFYQSVKESSDEQFNAGTKTNTMVAGTGSAAKITKSSLLATDSADVIATGSTPYSAAYDPTQNAVWVVIYASNTLQKFNASTGAQIGANIATGTSPYGVAYDSTQNAVWVVNDGSNTLQKFNASTGAQIGANIATGTQPRDVVYDPTQNAVWVVNYGASNLQKFNASTGAQIGTNITTGLGPIGVAYDPTQNAVWVTSPTANVLQKFNASTGAQIGANIATGINPYRVAYDPTQNAVWVTSSASSILQKFDASTGAQIGTNITTGTSPRGVAYDPTQNAVWVANYTSNTLQKFKASDGLPYHTAKSIATGTGPRSLVYDSTQNAVWVANYSSSTLQKFNASTGAQIGANIVTGTNPFAVAYDQTQNAVWVVNWTANTLQKFNAATGAQIGANITTGTGPRGVAYDPTQNAVWVANWTANTLQKFNAATGAQIGANITTGTNPSRVFYDPAQNAVWVPNYTSNTLQKFNASDGSLLTTIPTNSSPVYAIPDSTQNAVWVANYSSNTLQKFNAATGAQIGSNIATGTNPDGVAYDLAQNAVWVANVVSNTLQKFNASTGAQIGANIATGTSPRGVAYDSTQNAVWVVNEASNTLQQILILNYAGPTGTFESRSIDLGSAVDFSAMSWNPAAQPANTSLSFQLVANNDNATWNYVGPDGTAATYFTASGTAIPSGLDNNRYFRYKAYLSTTDSTVTPQLDDVTVSFASQNVADRYVSDVSDSVFEIRRPVITVTEPGSADTNLNYRWLPGDTKTILWQTQGRTAENWTVECLYLTGNPLTQYTTTVFTGAKTYDSFDATYYHYSQSWTIPSNHPLSDFAKIRVTASGTDAQGNAVTDSGESTPYFKIVASATLSIVSPGSGANWYINSSANSIQWNMGAPVGDINNKTVTIQVSTDAPLYATWTTVTATAVNNESTLNSFSWDIPSSIPASTAAKIKIFDNARPSTTDTTAWTFNLIAPSVTIASPLLDEEWIAGEPGTVSWTSTNGVKTPLTLKWSSVNSPSDTTITSTAVHNTVTQSGSFSWAAVANSNPGASGDVATLKIFDPTYSATTPLGTKQFKIVRPVITLSAPVGAETWRHGEQRQITWSTTPVPAVSTEVRIEYSIDNGSTWSAVAESEGMTPNDGIVVNDGSFLWTIPNLGGTGNQTTQAKIRITDAQAASSTHYQAQTAQSTVFSILRPNFSITLPAQTPLRRGGTYTFMWSPEGTMSTILDIGYDPAGVSFSSIAGQGTFGGTYQSFTWTVPVTAAVPTSSARVRVSDGTSPFGSGTSAAFGVDRQRLTFDDTTVSGAAWVLGTTHTLGWTTEGEVTTLNIAFYRNTAPVGTIDATVGNNNLPTGYTTYTSYPKTYSWTIPNNDAYLAAGDANIVLSAQVPLDALVNDSSAMFTIREPYVTVTLPAIVTSSGYWVQNESQNIAWSADGSLTSGGTLQLSYANRPTTFTPSGLLESDWVPITTVATTVSSYAWTPNLPSGYVAVRVKDTNPNRPASVGYSSVFQMSAEPLISILAPTGTPSWRVGTDQTISWANMGSVSNLLTLEYSTDNGATWNACLDSLGASAVNLPATGAFVWRVPASALPVASASRSVRLKITDTQRTTTQMSPTPVNVTIVPPLTTVTAPASGNTWLVGQTTNSISWTTDGGEDLSTYSALIQYFSPATSTWVTVTGGANVSANARGSTTFGWTIPDDVGTSQVRVTSNVRPATTSGTSANFTIAKLALVGYPGQTPNESYTVGASTVITWSPNAVSVLPNVNLQYFDGTNWYDMTHTTLGGATSLVNSAGASYTWTIPDTVTALAKVRVVDPNNPTVLSESANVFKIAGSVNLTAPSTGASWIIGTGQNVTWSVASGTMTNMKLQYSPDGGTTWKSMSGFSGAATTVANTGTYAWTIPDDFSATAVVRVYEENNLSNTSQSAGFFTIASPQITISQPTSANNGTGALTISEPFNILWTTTGSSVNNLRIEASYDGQATWTTVSASWPNTGSYGFTPTQTTSQGWIRITELSSTHPSAIATGGPFTILPTAQITISAPATGNTWIMGNTYNILWSTQGLIFNNLRISYTLDSTVPTPTWVDIASGQLNTLSYYWAVPDLPSVLANQPNAKVKITDDTEGTVGTSTVFTLGIPTVSVARPAGGEVWAVGDVAPVQWSYAGAVVGPMTLQYDAGGTVTDTSPTIATGVAKTGVVPNTYTYDWTVPVAAQTATVRVRVKDSQRPNSRGDSAAVFTVIPAPTVTVSAPANGSIFVVEEPMTVTWATRGLGIEKVNLEYWNDTDLDDVLDAGETLNTIATDVLRGSAGFTSDTSDAYSGRYSGTYTWTVPQTAPVSSNLKLRVRGLKSDNTEVATGLAAGHFRIRGGFEFRDETTPTQVLSSTTDWKAGTGHNVKWYNKGSFANVRLEYATSADGLTWGAYAPIAASLANAPDGTNVSTYAWTVADPHLALYPAEPPALYYVKLKLTDLADTTINAESNAFRISYYTVTWRVQDYDTFTLLDSLTVTSTYGATNYWQVANDGLTAASDPRYVAKTYPRRYPYGTFTTFWSKSSYIDRSDANRTISADATVTVYLESVLSAQMEYKVYMGSAYDETADTLMFNTWLEKKGTLVLGTDPDLGLGGTAYVNIYDGQTLIATLTSASAPDANGNYWFNASGATQPVSSGGLGLVSGKTYFAKVGIWYRSREYQSGASFDITLAQQLKALVETVQTSVASVATTVAVEGATTRAQIASESTTTRQSVDAVRTDTGRILTAAETTLPQQIKTETQALKTEVATAAKSEILNRENIVMLGNTIVIKYRTYAGAAPVLTVYDPDNLARISGAPMVEVSPGLYEYAVLFESFWETGDYSIVCSEPSYGTLDAIVITAKTADIESISSDLGTVMGSVAPVRDLKGKLDAFTAAFTLIEENIERAAEAMAGAQAGTEEAAHAAQQMESLYNSLREMSGKIQELGATVGYDLEKLYEVSESRTRDIDYIRNKTQELKALLLLSQQMIEGAAKEEPVVQTWFEFR